MTHITKPGAPESSGAPESNGTTESSGAPESSGTRGKAATDTASPEPPPVPGPGPTAPAAADAVPAPSARGADGEGAAGVAAGPGSRAVASAPGWDGAVARVVRVARGVRARAVRGARRGRGDLARALRSLRARSARLTTAQFVAVAVVVGMALAAGAVTAAGPWSADGRRVAERERAATGADHGSGSRAGAPRPAPSAAAVLAGLGRTRATGKSLADVLDPLLGDPSLGDHRGAAVVDVATGRRLYAKDVDAGLTPASTTKIATAVAALSALGPDHRLTTRTVLEPGTKKVVLVGGGDPTLTAREKADGWASLRTLADTTAAALKKRHLTSVTLTYDTSLYAGMSRHPLGVNENLAAVTPLTADEGRLDDSTSGPAPRAADPAEAAAHRFAALLGDHGVKATPAGSAGATDRAKALASVQSPPLTAVVERMLTHSDNDIAEALARQTALGTGGKGSFAGGAAAVGAQVKKLGLPVEGAEFHDGSGLDRRDKLTARLLTSLLALAGSKDHPELRPVLTGLPVAGFTGTLSDRYESTDSRAGTGFVRAKTGSLTGVNTLAGTVVDTDGHLLAFAFLTENSMDQPAARAALDRAAARLASR